MAIETAEVPASKTDFANLQQVGELLERVRTQSMPVRFVTKGVTASAGGDKARTPWYRAWTRTWLGR